MSREPSESNASASTEFDGKIALVAGVGPGLGSAIAERLARAGASVVGWARSRPNLESIMRRLSGGPHLPLCVDFTDPVQCGTAMNEVLAEFGHVDIAVGNGHRPAAPWSIYDDDLDEWHKALEVNLLGMLNIVKVASTAMRGGGGAVVTVSSMAARRVDSSILPYSTTKAALEVATIGLARELGPVGIRVNCVAPGYIDGPALRTRLAARASAAGVDKNAELDRLRNATALGRIATADEVAEIVTFLSSPRSSPLTGVVVDANAGQWMPR